MKNRQPKIYYRRNLPHYQPPDGTFFVTSRLAGSLPQEVVARLRHERDDHEKWLTGITNTAERISRWRDYQSEYFEKFDSLLDGDTAGPLWLRDARIASLVADSLKFYDGTHYDLIAYCIMPNHIHVICTLLPAAISQEHLNSDEPSAPYILTTIFQSIKKYTARKANAALGRSGNFWQQESYDHTIKTSEELQRMIYYVINNPLKANLCGSWDQWPWTYVKDGWV